MLSHVMHIYKKLIDVSCNNYARYESSSGMLTSSRFIEASSTRKQIRTLNYDIDYIKTPQELLTFCYICQWSAYVNSSRTWSLGFFFYILLTHPFCFLNLISNLKSGRGIPHVSQFVYLFSGRSFRGIRVLTFLHQIWIKRWCIFGNFWTTALWDLFGIHYYSYRKS